MKSRRHAKVLEIIEKKEIDTQEELAEELRRNGFNVTQATVSRDIKELRLIKTLTASGKYKYSAVKPRVAELTDRHVKIFADAVLDIDYAGNIIVIKTISGAAMGAAEAIDVMGLEDFVGSIAGDNTIFVVVRDQEKALDMVNRLRRLIK